MDINIFNFLKNLNIETLKKKSEEVFTLLKDLETTGESGGGFVKVTIDGNFNIIFIDFDVNNELIKGDLIMLRDLIISAHNDAVSKMREEIQKKFSNLIIPGIL